LRLSFWCEMVRGGSSWSSFVRFLGFRPSACSLRTSDDVQVGGQDPQPTHLPNPSSPFSRHRPRKPRRFITLMRPSIRTLKRLARLNHLCRSCLSRALAASLRPFVGEVDFARGPVEWVHLRVSSSPLLFTLVLQEKRKQKNRAKVSSSSSDTRGTRLTILDCWTQDYDRYLPVGLPLIGCVGGFLSDDARPQPHPLIPLRRRASNSAARSEALSAFNRNFAGS
jgi:hypothetical protein